MESTDQKSPAIGVENFILERKQKSDRPSRAMATIEDDDERLLNQIGYTQVGISNPSMICMLKAPGYDPAFLKMVNSILCHISPGGSRFRPSNVRKSTQSWRTSFCCVGMGIWFFNGILYIGVG